MGSRLVLPAIVAIAAVGLSACSALRDDAQIVTPSRDFGSAGVIYHDTPEGRPYTVGDFIICLDRPGRAVIDEIEVKDAFGGLHLDSFAVIPNAMERGAPGFTDDNRTIAEHGIATRPIVVDRDCPIPVGGEYKPTAAEPKSFALILQYRRQGTQTAGNRGIVLHYTSGGNRYQSYFDWEILLCAPGDTTTEDCRPAE